jgi:RNA-directed DNA polymerase
VPFERYCDDAVIHCGSEVQAHTVRDALAQRLAAVGLELHPGKTRIVYGKDADRRGDQEVTSFTFLGYTFRPRLARTRWGKQFVSFLPAVSKEAIKAMGRELRSWHIVRRSDKSLTDLARMFNSIVQGWINYYGRFYKSMLYPLLRRSNEHLVRWGLPQVQAATPTRTASAATAGGRLPAIPTAVRPLAHRPQTRRLDDGSPVS